MTNKPKLLIIEDEAAILRGLTDLFVFHGFDVASEQDGRKGLETALSGKFDCILLDVMLPSMDGFSVCNAIRNASREQPIVMLTAKSSEEDNQAVSSQAFDVLINKTLDDQEKIAPSQSMEVVQRALRIENFYSDITQAHEKPPSFQFELTA